MERLKDWARSRTGVAALALSVLGTLGSIHSATDIATAPFRFLVYLAVVVGVLWVLARLWESKTAPPTEQFARPRQIGGSPQLRQDLNARMFRTRGGFLFERRHYFTATSVPPVKLSRAAFERIRAEAASRPVSVVSNGQRTWWRFGDTYWWENVGYGPGDVLALLRQRERQQERHLNHAHMMLNAETAPVTAQQRYPITKEMREAVYTRDGGHCNECGSAFDLQYDHIIPVAMGGATTIDNLQLLCSKCNQSKGGRL